MATTTYSLTTSPQSVATAGLDATCVNAGPGVVTLSYTTIDGRAVTRTLWGGVEKFRPFSTVTAAADTVASLTVSQDSPSVGLLPMTEAALHGMVGLACSPAQAVGTALLVAGVMEVVRVPVTAGAVVSSLVLDVTTAGSAAVAYAVAYTPDGSAQLGVTADIGQAGNVLAVPGTTVNNLANMAAPFLLPWAASSVGWVWIGLLGASGTTQPTMRCSVAGGAVNAMDFGLLSGVGGSMRTGKTGSGLSTPPASFTPSALTSNNHVFLIGLR